MFYYEKQIRYRGNANSGASEWKLKHFRKRLHNFLNPTYFIVHNFFLGLHSPTSTCGVKYLHDLWSYVRSQYCAKFESLAPNKMSDLKGCTVNVFIFLFFFLFWSDWVRDKTFFTVLKLHVSNIRGLRTLGSGQRKC